MKYTVLNFDLCPRTQLLTLKLCPSGGHPFGLWPVLFLSDGKMDIHDCYTQYMETLGHFLLYHNNIKMMHVFFFFI
jgi:hypothetical protein